MKNNFLILFLTLFALQPSYAYLDPGTGSMLLSALIAIFASIFFIIKTLYYKLSSLFLRITGVKVDKTKHDIIFYSEGHNYWSTFKPIVEGLLNSEQKIVFLTSSEKDPVLKFDHPLLEAKYIGEGNKAFVYLSFIEAEICILTTPGLNVLQLKRSKGVKKYVHLLHSLASVSLYKIFSFDYFDTILCSGNYQKDQLRLLENRRKMPHKELLDSGCPYLDTLFLRKKIEPSPSKRDKPTILIAPSWGANGLLNHISINTFIQIANSNMHIIIRPHPQSIISEQTLISNLQTHLAQYPNIEWDYSTDNFPSLAKSDLLISDFSGITFDFALVFEKPIITIKTETSLDGIEHFDLQDHPIWEDQIIAQLGLRLQKSQLNALHEHIIDALHSDLYTKKINQVKKDQFFNLGNSQDIITQQIITLIKETKDAQ